MYKTNLIVKWIISILVFSLFLACEEENEPPIIRISVTTSFLFTGYSIGLECDATDPDSESLTYSWSATGGTISGTSTRASWKADEPGTYTISVIVSDGENTVNASTKITVQNTLSVTPSVLNFGTEDTEMKFEITNPGERTEEWWGGAHSTVRNLTGNSWWSGPNPLTTDKDKGSLTKESETITVTLDRKDLNPGKYETPITIQFHGGVEGIKVYFEVGTFIYLDSNGITVKATEDAEIGKTYTLDGKSYKVVSLSQLKNAITNGEDLTKLVTTFVTDMSNLFSGKSFFNKDISNWDVSNVTNMSSMFYDAIRFNKPLEFWDVGVVVDMSSMFNGAEEFNQNIGDWDVRNVRNMERMFVGARKFNQPIDDWGVFRVTDMNWMFGFASSFNQPLNSWHTQNVTDMSNMFKSADDFNQPIGSWDLSDVTDMSSMFESANYFNQSLENWNVEQVTNMSHMFDGAYSFNQPLENWHVWGVKDMSYMFDGAWDFNQPIGSWDVSNVIDMTSMFKDAGGFKQDLSSWCVSQFSGKPLYFDYNAYVGWQYNKKPQWGTCPN